MSTTTTPQPTPPTRPETPAPGRGGTASDARLTGLGLATLLLGAALPMTDFFIVNVALPSIERDLRAGPAVLEMVAAAYAMAYAVLLVLGGRLGDTYGRRRLFLWGAAAFGLTSLACGLAPDAWTLVAARAAQGAASAVMLPQVLATIHATTSGGRRGRALGLYGATGGVAGVAGQLLGGLLVSADLLGTGWRAIFLVNVPVVAAILLLGRFSVPDSRAARPSRGDRAGTALFALALVALLLPLTEGRAAGGPLWSWLLLAAAPLLAWAFYVVERRAERSGGAPLLPPSLLREPGLRRGLAVAVPLFAGFGGFMFVVAVALQQGLGLSPVVAGAAIVPMSVTYLVTSMWGPRLVPRLGSRVLTAGAVAHAVGLALLAATVLTRWPDLDPVSLAPAMAVIGAGQGFQLPTYFRVMLASVPPERAGAGSGLSVTAQQTCLALGVAVIGSVYLGLVPSMGTRDALLTALAVQFTGLLAMTALSLRLPRTLH
ncbi:MFS transporter [Streptomyces sp. NPDC053542]|uniref:MFS transporter n=1 Tax=Streptomyces sp. NPDC053542 TaxID=3365710 RepID=UPI0037D004C7